MSQPRNRPPPQSLEKCASRRGPGLGAALAAAVAPCPVTPPPRGRCRRRTCYPAPGCGVRSETTSFYRHLRGQSDVAGRLVPRFPDARLLSPTARNLALVTCDACTRWVRSGLKSLRIARRRARQEKPPGRTCGACVRPLQAPRGSGQAARLRGSPVPACGAQGGTCDRRGPACSSPNPKPCILLGFNCLFTVDV